MAEDEVQPGGVGWKLHLAVPEANQDLVEAGLQGMGITPDTETHVGDFSYKRGRSSGQEGKDFTVYAGHRDDADIIASAINEQMGDLLGDASHIKTDTPMVGNVVGRFDAQASVGGPSQPVTMMPGIPQMDSTEGVYSKWGSGGVPLLSADKRAEARGDIDYAAAEQRATESLTERYGEAFTGSQNPAQFAEPAPAGGGGGGGGGFEPPPAPSFSGGGGSGPFKFDRRKLFEVVDEAVAEHAEELKAMAQIEAPYVTGKLHDSHMVEKFAPSSYGVFATAPYARDVHEGHKVKNRKGGKSYGKTTGNPWFKRAINNLAQ
jgi:hypothetical protein